MRQVALKFETQLKTEECANCHMLFAMPADFIRRRSEEGGSFFCPQGHGQSYTATKVMELEKELAATRNRLELAAKSAKIANQEAERERKSRRRIEKRIHAGVCPHCQRTFSQLARHMESKHSNL